MSIVVAMPGGDPISEAEPQAAEGGGNSKSFKLLVVLMLFGAALRILRYLSDRSLWLDEAYLANSILTYSFKQLLTRPLMHWQAAPPGFLLLQKAAVSVFGTSEYALRIVPLLAGLASIPIFFGVVRRCLNPTAQVLAMALFITLDPLIYYSAEAKQYGLDVTAALAIVLTALRLRERPKDLCSLLVVAMCAVFGILCSHPAIFVVYCVQLVLLIDFLRRRQFGPAVRIAAVAIVCIAAFVADYFLFLRPLMGHNGLQAYWAADYMPHEPLEAVKWVGAALYQLYSGYATMWMPVVDTAILATLVGFVPLWRRDRTILALLMLPLALTLAAAMVHAYPFASRLVLFLVPSIVVLIGAGSAMIWESIKPGAKFVAVLILLSIYAPTAARDLFYVVVPQKREEIRPVLAYIRDHKQPGDLLYVFYISDVPFRYYRDRFGLTTDRSGLSDMTTLVGKPGAADPAQYRADLSQLRGRGRVWVLITHPRALGGPDEEQIFPQILKRWGREIDHVQAFNASATLYDLDRAKNH
jgi:hypothetical protein